MCTYGRTELHSHEWIHDTSLRPVTADPFIFSMSDSPLIGLPGAQKYIIPLYLLYVLAAPLIGVAKRVLRPEGKGVYSDSVKPM